MMAYLGVSVSNAVSVSTVAGFIEVYLCRGYVVTRTVLVRYCSATTVGVPLLVLVQYGTVAVVGVLT